MRSYIFTAMLALASFTHGLPTGAENEDYQLTSRADADSDGNDQAKQLFTRNITCCRANADLSCANAIADALIKEDTEPMTVMYGGYVTLRTRGNCKLRGQAIGTPLTSSYARDVGYGLRHLINSCPVRNRVCAVGTAGGNGHFEIRISS